MTIKRLFGARLSLVGMGLSASMLMLGGCGGGSSSGGTGGADASTSSSGTSGASSGTGGASAGTMFVYGTVVLSSDFTTRTGYIKFAPSLAAGSQVDESKTIEASGEVTVYGMDNTGEFFAVEADTGKLIKYKLNADDSITEVGEMSFVAYNVNAFRTPLVAFASGTKAYLWDELTRQAFVWNPSTLSIVSSVDLSASFNGSSGGKDYHPFREREPILSGGKFYAAVNYYDEMTAMGLPYSEMIIIDTATDAFSVKHTTCGGLMNSMLGPDGYIYSATSGLHAAAHKAGFPGASAPCMVRFDPMKGDFDGTFRVELNSVAQGKTVAGLVPNAGALGYVRVFNEALLPPNTPSNSILALLRMPVWETHIIDVTKPTSLTPVTTQPTTAFTIPFRTDGRVYTFVTDAMGANTTLLDMTTNPPTAGHVGRGIISVARRLR